MFSIEMKKIIILIIVCINIVIFQSNTYAQEMQEEDVALTQSAETMGNLAEILEEIAVELENNERINGKIKKALTYPIILGAFAVIAVVILLLYVIPSIVTMFPSPESLPRITKVMMKASSFLWKTRYIIAIVIVSLIGLYKFAYKNILAFKMFVDKVMITIPAVSGVVKGFYMYRFTRLLSQLYNAWVSPTISLKLMGKTFSNFFYRKKVMEIRGNLNAGFWFAESMEWSPLFDPILVQIIHVGEQTGNIAEVLSKMSTFYSDTLQTKIDVLMGMIEPLMMAVIAIIIWVIVASIFLPMADMVNVIM